MQNHVANEINRQIGSEAFLLLGTKRKSTGPADNYLFFDCKGRKCSWIRVTLDPNDTYTVEFFKGKYIKSVIKESGIYCDQLLDVLEKNTGLYVSFRSR